MTLRLAQARGEQIDIINDGDIVLINKPVGITSFDVIRRLRHISQIKKMGHAGTLDPLAEGLMILAVGRATKELPHFVGMDKTYVVSMLVGEQSITGDAEGEIIAMSSVSEIDLTILNEAVASIVGCHVFPVPAFSAVKQKGQPLYKEARRGNKVTPPERKMCVHECKVIESESVNDKLLVSLEMVVASGVYVRSIVEAIGRALGYPARVETLVRTCVGKYSLTHAFELPKK